MEGGSAQDLLDLTFPDMQSLLGSWRQLPDDSHLDEFDLLSFHTDEVGSATAVPRRVDAVMLPHIAPAAATACPPSALAAPMQPPVRVPQVNAGTLHGRPQIGRSRRAVAAAGEAKGVSTSASRERVFESGPAESKRPSSLKQNAAPALLQDTSGASGRLATPGKPGALGTLPPPRQHEPAASKVVVSNPARTPRPLQPYALGYDPTLRTQPAAVYSFRPAHACRPVRARQGLEARWLTQLASALRRAGQLAITWLGLGFGFVT